jgi:hypothetical protein
MMISQKKRFPVVVALLLAILCLSGCDFSIQKNKSSVAITSTPDRAQVFINGTPQGETPATVRGLAAGAYMVELRKEGYSRAYKSISLLDGQEMVLDLKLNEATGLLLVESNPSGAEILVDGISKGTTPALLTDLPLGSYPIEFRAASQLPRTITAELVSRIPVRIFAELISNTARLTVNSDPEGAEVRIDGNLMGVTPLVIEQVQAGESEVKGSKRGYRPYLKKMSFEATKPYTLGANLEALPSGLTVISSPEGAKIFIDNRPIGTAPFTRTDIKEGTHEITAKLLGYGTQSQTIQLEPDTNDSVEFNLVKDSGTLVVDTEPAYVEIYVDGKLLATTQPKGSSDSLSQPVRILLKSDREHQLQFVREGFLSTSDTVKTEIDQVVTRHKVLKRIFVYDTRITTDTEIIKCRVEYKLPNGDIYYERFPGVFNTVKAAAIRKVETISLDDASNRAARRLIEQNKKLNP